MKESIAQGDITPNEFFSDKEIAEIFKISRMPVREATQRLESEGYIERVHMKGNRVIGLSDRDIAHIYSIRKNLESFLLRYTAMRISSEEIRCVENILSKAESLRLEFDREKFVEKWVPMVLDFNRVVFEASQIPQLSKMVLGLREQVERFKVIHTLLLYHIEESFDARKKLVTKFRERDSQGASDIWCKHFDFVFSIWLEKVARKTSVDDVLKEDEYLKGLYFLNT